MTQEEADALPFDHLDSTKLIPEELIPLKIIGRMVLNRWPDNFFAETEQVAFCPANIVPGIDFSEDPLLQGRLFSYLDTQLIRLGGPNFTQIPVNAPKCPFQNTQRDGHMQMQVPAGRTACEPQSLDPDGTRASLKTGFRSASVSTDGAKSRIRADSFADHYSQARMFYRSQSAVEQAHLASALVFELSKVETEHVRLAMVSQVRTVDESLAQRVADGLGLKSLPAAVEPVVPVQDMELSPALRIIDRMKDTLAGRAVGILIADGSNSESLSAMKTALGQAGAMVKLVAQKRGVTLSDGTYVTADGQLAGTPSVVFDGVVSILPMAEAEKLVHEAAAIDWFRDAFGHLKAIAACKGTHKILQAAGIVPDAGVVAPEDINAFIDLAKTRQWAREPGVRTLA